MTVLDVRHLTVRRGDRVVIADVSFSVGRSEVLALMGASGSGKTTLLRALAGLDHPAAGTVSVGGGRVGMVLQFHHLFAHLTALQNVWLAPVHVHRQPRPAAVVKAMALLEQLGVAHRAEAMPGELSGGEAQRVAIARALAMDPAVLLMDEPTASLDAGRRSELAATLRGLAAGGCALVVATHDAAFVDACATRTLVVRDGRIQ